MRFAIACIVITTLTVIGIIALVIQVEKVGCDKYREQTFRQGYYSAWTGCMIKTDTGWYELDQIRSIDD